MFFFVNLLGLVVFLGIGVLASRNRKEIQWRSVASLLTLNLMLAWFLTSFEIGREMITAAAAGFTELINISYVGIAFVFPDWVHVPQMNFFAAALLPILFVVPLFDILTYFGILPFVIRWIGKLLTFLTRAEVRVILRHRDDVSRQHERNTIVARNVSYMILSGLLVSLLSAAICGLFVW